MVKTGKFSRFLQNRFATLLQMVAPVTAENVSFFVKIWKLEINIKIPLFVNNGIFSLVN